VLTHQYLDGVRHLEHSIRIQGNQDNIDGAMPIFADFATQFKAMPHHPTMPADSGLTLGASDSYQD
jgi:hypothetical protein